MSQKIVAVDNNQTRCSFFREIIKFYEIESFGQASLSVDNIFLVLFVSISVFFTFQRIWSYVSLVIDSLILVVQEVYNWIIDVCQVIFYTISEKLDIFID
jgi:hypothetical protein